MEVLLFSTIALISRTDNKITQPSHHGTYESAMMQKICENVYQIDRFLNLFSSC